MIEKIIRTLLHPRMMMASFGVLAVYAGLATIVYGVAFSRFSNVWGMAGMLSGFAVFAASIRPGRTIAALSGATFIVVAVARAIALVEAIITPDQGSTLATAQLGVSASQWLTTAYISWVIWNRQVIPWSVICQEDRQRERASRSGRG